MNVIIFVNTLRNIVPIAKKHYDVSTEEYKAKRAVNDNYVYGYLVKDKQGNIQGILNKATHYYELAWVKENTIEQIFSVNTNNECMDYVSNQESYPLCKGIGEEKCRNCCLYENYEEYHSPYSEK